MLRLLNKKKKTGAAHKKQIGQVTLEYIFCLLVLYIMMYGLIKVFAWSGTDLIDRRLAHEDTLLNGNLIVPRYSDMLNSPLRQIHPFFYFPESMNAVWPGSF